MEPNQAQELLASINERRLVIVCGAGLSMAPPTSAPSAAALAQECADQFRLLIGGAVPVGTERDLEKLVEFFFSSPPTRAQFLGRLVDWPRFSRSPNGGHTALADFLGCGATEAVVTTNFDLSIEVAARELGEPDFQSAVDGGEMNRVHEHKPLLKLHGCMSTTRERDKIIWCRGQLEGPLRDAEIVRRIGLSKAWLQANLRGRDIIFVGFWSDWAYLNQILESVLDGVQPTLVCLVDPKTEDGLKEKAPGLWNLANNGNVTFRHIPQSGAEFLTELRKRLSIVFFERLLNESLPTYRTLAKVEEAPFEFDLPHALDADELYDLRRDLCGIPHGHAVRHSIPHHTMHTTGAAHLMMQRRGDQFIGGRYPGPNGCKIRIVNGAGHVLSLVKREFSRGQPNTASKEIVICASADDDGNAKTDIVRGDLPADIIRSGSESDWLTFQQARERGLC